MNNRQTAGHFLSFGLLSSLCWHAFWVFFLVPVLKAPSYTPVRSSSVFLGAVLKDADLKIPVFLRAARPVERGPDLSREDYFSKYPFGLRKPMTSVSAPVPQELPVSLKKAPEALRKVQEAAFGFKDSGEYLEHVDFSDLKNYALRQELSGFAEFQVFLASDGQVERIKKTVSSGDPVLDLSLMRKLKTASFKGFFRRNAWIRVHFRLR